MATAKVNLTIQQGATFRRVFTFKYKDENGLLQIMPLAGYSARMQIRANRYSAAPYASFNTGTGITVDEVNNTITLVIPASETETYQWRHGVYDFEIIEPSGGVLRVLQGDVVLSREVTR